MHRRWRRWGAGAAWLLLPASLWGQSVTLDGPPSAVLPSITPALQFRANGLANARPLQVTVQIATGTDFGALLLDSTFTTMDTSVTVQVTRPLPGEANVYWRARVRTATGALLESPTFGPRVVPSWLMLITPNSPTGNAFDIRRPLFVWRSAPVSPLLGPWRYDVEVLSAGRAELGVSGLTDTTYRPINDLQANTSYRWTVRASLRNGAAIKVMSAGTFVITDPPLPTTTLLFQNFPNPFPNDVSFSTCFWFDVGEPGAVVSLDILDLRGTQVKRVIPAADGTDRFAPGRYGRGVPGAASNCDNRFIWDGTAADGRVVAPGIYLARFRANTAAPVFRRIVFRGR